MDSVYDSKEPTSIASAVILKLKYPESTAYDIHDTKDRPKGKHYHFTDDEEAAKGAKKVKEVKKDGKRVRSLWLELFPNQAPPLVIHILGDFEKTDEKREERGFFKNSIVGELGSVNDAWQFSTWKQMIEGNRGAIEGYIRMGRHIHNYLSAISKKAPKKKADADKKPADKK